MLRMLRGEYHCVIPKDSSTGRKGRNKSPEAQSQKCREQANESNKTDVLFSRTIVTREFVDEKDCKHFFVFTSVSSST